MITIVYDRPNHSLTAQGHAGSGEAGHDLVCASVSALVYTLAVNVERLGQSAQIRLDSGDAVVHCIPSAARRLMASYLYDSICVGFELIAKQYPEFISYSIVEG